MLGLLAVGVEGQASGVDGRCDGKGECEGVMGV